MSDLIGKKLNLLTVVDMIFRKEKNGKNRSYLKCSCDCGNITEIQRNKFGITKSCGCIKHNRNFKTSKLEGQIFGKLLVMKECEPFVSATNKKRRKRWLCKCECGTEIKVIENSLITENTMSCGCKLGETLRTQRFLDLTGKKYVRLLVVGFIERKDRHCIWKCSCDCGNIINVRANNILNGTTTSCGCLFKEKITKHGLSYDLKAYTAYLRTDPERRLKHRTSSSIRKAIKDNGGIKNGSIWKFLPYTSVQLKEHLESLWEPWMNWDNYGGNLNDPRKTWHIDHITPQCKFSFTSMDDEEFIECWRLNNLRPLEKIENNIKRCN